MRKATEGNPVIQILVLGGLALVLALMMYVRVLHKSSSSSPAPSSSGAPAASEPSASSPVPDQGSAGATGQAGSTAAATPPATSESAPAPPAGADQVAPSGAAAGVTAMTPGEGLPVPVSRAYRKGDVVVLSIYQRGGLPARINLRALRQIQRAHGIEDSVAIFRVPVSEISRYARIAQGVDVNRAPALVVIKPQSLNAGDTPEASVRYGYMGARSAAQSVFDAVYSGPELQYYPD